MSLLIILSIALYSATTSREIPAEASSQTLTIDCRSKKIDITSATYGKNCGAESNNQLANLQTACNGLYACGYTIDDSIIGDPATGCSKNYQYSYECIDSPATATPISCGETITGTTPVDSTSIFTFTNDNYDSIVIDAYHDKNNYDAVFYLYARDTNGIATLINYCDDCSDFRALETFSMGDISVPPEQLSNTLFTMIMKGWDSSVNYGSNEVTLRCIKYYHFYHYYRAVAATSSVASYWLNYYTNDAEFYGLSSYGSDTGDGVFRYYLGRTGYLAPANHFYRGIPLYRLKKMDTNGINAVYWFSTKTNDPEAVAAGYSLDGVIGDCFPDVTENIKIGEGAYEYSLPDLIPLYRFKSTNGADRFFSTVNEEFNGYSLEQIQCYILSGPVTSVGITDDTIYTSFSWYGAAPICGGGKSNCNSCATIFGETCLAKDKVGAGPECTNGKKALCVEEHSSGGSSAFRMPYYSFDETSNLYQDNYKNFILILFIIVVSACLTVYVVFCMFSIWKSISNTKSSYSSIY